MAGAKESAAAAPSAYVVHVPVRFIVVTLIGSVFLAFGVGQAARLFVTHGMEEIPFLEGLFDGDFLEGELVLIDDFFGDILDYVVWRAVAVCDRINRRPDCRGRTL